MYKEVGEKILGDRSCGVLMPQVFRFQPMPNRTYVASGVVGTHSGTLTPACVASETSRFLWVAKASLQTWYTQTEFQRDPYRISTYRYRERRQKPHPSVEYLERADRDFITEGVHGPIPPKLPVW